MMNIIVIVSHINDSLYLLPFGVIWCLAPVKINSPFVFIFNTKVNQSIALLGDSFTKSE